MSDARMPDFEGLSENFAFLVLKIQQQMEDALQVLESHETSFLEKMNLREDYIDNLKIIIERKSYKKILRSRSEDNRMIRVMGSVNTAASNLEEIGDYLINIVSQTKYLTDRKFMADFDYHAYFREISVAMDLIVVSLFKGNIKDALTICRAELELDRFFKKDFDKIMDMLRRGQAIGDAITALNILRYLERIGDALLNIGEAIISAYAGTRLKLFEYMALKENLHSRSEEFVLQDIDVETRSGCRIEKIVGFDAPDTHQEVIFKEGDLGKIESEKQKLEKWQTIMPGLTPKIFGFQHLHEKAFLLMEYIGGYNFQEILLGHHADILPQAFARLTNVVDAVWTKTKTDETARADFVRQLQKKIRDVYDVHPSLQSPTKFISQLKQPALEELLEIAGRIEQEIYAPFSVFIHGDFNADNIIYNEQEDRIYFIDPHRSEWMDYVQDVSVFMVSNLRIPVFEPEIRERLVRIIIDFYMFSRAFAEKNHDALFEARLTLGIIRSLISSTRFILKEDFSKDLYLRGIYLLEKLLDHQGKPWESFILPQDVFHL